MSICSGVPGAKYVGGCEGESGSPANLRKRITMVCAAFIRTLTTDMEHIMFVVFVRNHGCDLCRFTLLRKMLYSGRALTS